MDLFVERKYVEAVRAGDSQKFLELFDPNFADVYRYVARRVSDRAEVERIVRLTFLDALGQAASTPTDTAYVIWLFSLAKPRVWNYIAETSFPEKQGLISANLTNAKEEEVSLVANAEKMIGKLSLEEREILRLKFFEQVTDGEVAAILELDEGTVGQSIYRVLKRAHFLMFGEKDAGQGVYFGELAGLFERLRNLENIEVQEVLRLNLKMDLSTKIGKKDFAIDGEVEDVVEKVEKAEPFREKVEAKGSDDPAKIFVQAVQEMRDEEEREAEKEKLKFERREQLYDFVDRWKAALILVPVLFMVLVVGIVLFTLVDFKWPVERFANSCSFEVSFEGDFSKEEKKDVQKNISNEICDYFADVQSVEISKDEKGLVMVGAETEDWYLYYDFAKKDSDWRIKRYGRTASSNQESGEV